MTYEALREISGTWGLLILMATFVAVVIYAFRPGAKTEFERAARLPLMEEGESDD